MNMRQLLEVPEVYEARQRAHYDRIVEAYDAHYSDEWSLLYRRLFLYEPLIAGIELRGRKLLDAMCGSGQTAEYLLDQGAQALRTRHLPARGRVWREPSRRGRRARLHPQLRVRR